MTPTDSPYLDFFLGPVEKLDPEEQRARLVVTPMAAEGFERHRRASVTRQACEQLGDRPDCRDGTVIFTVAL